MNPNIILILKLIGIFILNSFNQLICGYKINHIYEITNYCEYEGNFIKNIIKINNILENIKSICTIIEDYDLLYKIQDLYKILIRDQVTLESLYV